MMPISKEKRKSTNKSMRTRLVYSIMLALNIAYYQLKSETFRTYAGALWWFVDPILNALIFYFLLVVVFNLRDENIFYIILSGLVVWTWFQSIVLQMANAIVANESLMRQLYLPKIVFIVSVAFKQIFIGLCAFLVLIFFLNFQGFIINIAYLFLPMGIFTLILFACGLGVFFASFVPFLPDIHKVMGYGFRIAMFASGVFYGIKRLPEDLAALISFNPMFLVIQMLRGILLSGATPDIWSFIYPLTLAIVFGAIGVSIVFKYDRYYGRILA